MKKNRQQWSRRRFINTLTGAGGLMMLAPSLSWVVDDPDPRVASIVAKTIGVDTHNHIDVPLLAAELPGPKTDMAGEMKKSGLSAICITFALDYQPLPNPGDAYERFLNGLDAMDAMLKDNDMKRSLNLADLLAANKEHQPTVVQSVEGCHFLEGKLDRMQPAYDRGLRQLGLLHDSNASVPLGDVYTNPPQWHGLTDFGSEVIKECNRLGILIDLAHASNETLDAALKLSTQPVIISHTGLDTQLGKNSSMAKMMRPRLISKEQARTVADAGSVIGVWTHLSDTPLEYAQNIRALVDIIGLNHVCLGTDTKMTLPYRSGGNFGTKPGNTLPQSDSSHQGPPHDNTVQKNGSGGDKNRGRAGERTNEAWQNQTAGFYYAVVDALLKTGFNEDEISRIGGGNFCRVFDAATKGH